MEVDHQHWVRPDIENRFKEGSIASRFNSIVHEDPADIHRDPDGDTRGESIREEELPADAVFLLVGYRAGHRSVRARRRSADRAKGPVHDPETFETNVPGLYVAGGAIAGVDTGTIFIENGRFHGEKVIEAIARRLEHRFTRFRTAG